MHIELAIGVVIVVFLIWWFLDIFNYGREEWFTMVVSTDIYEVGSIIKLFESQPYRGIIIGKRYAEGNTYYHVKLL